MSSVFSINLALSLLVVTLTIGTAIASPDEEPGGFSTPSSLKRLVVLDFKLTGDLGGRNFEAAHKQRIRVASEKLRDEFKRNKLYHVVDDAAALAVIERWSSEQNLHHCNGCELDMAKQLDAEQVLVPWVFRMSNLVLTMHVEIRDVATGRILMKKALDFRGDNDIGWTRAIAYLIRDMKERRNMKSRPTEEFVEDVLRFWFPERNGDHAAMVRQFAWWFRGGADSAIAERFPLLLERATRGELEHWSHRPGPRLALIIVLDQFSRSLYQGTAQAFAQDQEAVALALQGIEIGHYADLETPWEKTFFFLPLGHSEELTHLEVAVKLAEELVEQAPAELRRVLEHSAAQVRGHRDVIARFGRHPHRNAVLGRRSTPQELAYLASGQLVHTRALPQ